MRNKQAKQKILYILYTFYLIAKHLATNSLFIRKKQAASFKSTFCLLKNPALAIVLQDLITLKIIKKINANESSKSCNYYKLLLSHFTVSPSQFQRLFLRRKFHCLLNEESIEYPATECFAVGPPADYKGLPFLPPGFHPPRFLVKQHRYSPLY